MTGRRKTSAISIAIGLIGVMCAVNAALTVSAHDGRHAPASAKKLKNPLPATEANMARGRSLYEEHCASCHGTDGKSQTEIATVMRVKPADLTGKAMQRLTDGEAYWVITNGIKTSGMPAYKAKLSDRERWQMTLYMRRFKTAEATSTAAASAEQRYEVRGKVVSVDAKLKQIMLEHEEIKGYMGAMTMPFPLKDEKLYSVLKPGDLVQATLVVAASSWWLENVVVKK
jgi:mono/diheme cytochrome c family protein